MGNPQSCISDHPKVERIMPVSFRADEGAVSFLDLPPELRNNIYCRVLIFEEYLRPNSKVSAIRLLETCKQIHEEASSLFYAANSFYFYSERAIFWGQVDNISPQNFCENYPQGLTWPAARYHIYLTRLVFDAHVTLANRRNERDVEEKLRKRFQEFHTFLRSLWTAKERKWSDRVICDRRSPLSPLDCMIALSEDDEDVTKKCLRKY